MPTPPDLRDLSEAAPVLDSEVVFRGRVWDVRRDTVDLPTGPVIRDYVEHPGAVAVVALNADGQVLVIRQYRHPVGMHEWELPAGLLDVAGEPPVRCAARELVEEADLSADTWHHLLTYRSSPGGMNEVLHLFLARDLREVPVEERHTRTDEEAGMPTRWVGLDELCAAALDGSVGNAALIIGALATRAARESAYAGLTPAIP